MYQMSIDNSKQIKFLYISFCNKICIKVKYLKKLRINFTDRRELIYKMYFLM